jgi:hypothetical protein
MAKARSLLKHVGLWPDSPVAAHEPVQLTGAAERLAATAIAELAKSGVAVWLDGGGQVRFRSSRIPSRETKLAIERWGDLIEAFLRERTIEQESG